jgi:hypothetical protein
MKYVGSRPATKTYMGQLKVPTNLDIESSTRDNPKELFEPLKPILLDAQGLTSIEDVAMGPKCLRIVKELEPKIIPEKRKSVSFADGVQSKRMKPTISNPTSQVNLGNSVHTQQKKVQVTSNTEMEYVDVDVAQLCLRTTSPQRSPRNHASPSGGLTKDRQDHQGSV